MQGARGNCVSSQEGGKRSDVCQPIGDAMHMGARTRPALLLRVLDECGSHRVPFNISNGCDQMPVVHRIAGEAALPQIAGRAMGEVDPSGIAAI